METIWIPEKKLAESISRNEAFWDGQLEGHPLMWVIAENAKDDMAPIAPLKDRNEEWTNVDYAIEAAENRLARTHFAGDALPVYNPWLGPDQFGAWLGCELELRVRDFTSWVKPFVDDWSKHQSFTIDPKNKWWKLYIETLRRSVEAGKGKWATSYPDLHCGVDGLAAVRGGEKVMMDMLTEPESLAQPMKEMTRLFEYVYDYTSDIIVPGGQGTSNFTLGWSDRRFMCVGHNDLSCMLSPAMFDQFCLEDTKKCVDLAEITIYHLDGPDALHSLPRLLAMENLNTVEWIQGAGKPHPSKWLDLLKQIQAAGKNIQLVYAPDHGGDADIFKEIEILCDALDPTMLFFLVITDSAQKADAIVEHAKQVCLKK